MQTRTYGELFKLIRSLAGVGSFSTAELDDIANLINRRFLTIFNESPIWPRYLVNSEPRKIAALKIANSTTSVNGNYFLLGSVTGTGVTSGSSLYYNSSAADSPTSIIGTIIYQNSDASPSWVIATSGTVTKASDGTFTVTNTGIAQHTEADLSKKDFPYDVEHWNNSGDAGAAPTIFQKQFIPYSETRTISEDITKSTIGEFIRIHRKKAFINNSAIEYDFYVDEDGANILNIANTSDNQAFVTYKQQFTPFSVTGTQSSDFTNSTVEVPAEFFPYIAHATYADFLRMDGQTDKAFSEEERANLAKALELEKVDIISNNNTVNKKFSTYVNRQSR